MQCFQCGAEIGSQLGLCDSCKARRTQQPALNYGSYMGERGSNHAPQGVVQGRTGLPLENIGAGTGLLWGFFGTLWELIASPRSAFGKMRIEQSLWYPILFFLYIEIIGSILLGLCGWYFVSYLQTFPIADRVMAKNPELTEMLNQGLAHFLGEKLAVNLSLAVLVTFSQILYMLLGTLILRCNRNGARATALYVLYLFSAYAFLLYIPIFGGLVVLTWGIWMAIAGLAATQEISSWKASSVHGISILISILLLIPLAVLWYIFVHAPAEPSSPRDDYEIEAPEIDNAATA